MHRNRRTDRLAAVLLSLLLYVLQSDPVGAAEAPTPTFFAPLTVSRPFKKEARFLGELLSTRMVSTGRHAETASAAQEAQIAGCVRQTNRDSNSESCWVRLGQGQGARVMVSGELQGTRKRCNLVLRLTTLETRLTQRKFAESLSPCGPGDLPPVLERAARALAGLPPAGPPAPAASAPLAGARPSPPRAEAAQASPPSPSRAPDGERDGLPASTPLHPPRAFDAAGRPRHPPRAFGAAPGEGNAAAAGLQCPPPAQTIHVGRRRFCYHASEEPWEQAARRCAESGGQLARRLTPAESVALRDAIGAPKAGQIWLGISDGIAEGQWLDERDERVRYTHWAQTEPNDAGGGEDCATMLTHTTYAGVWWDVACDGRFPAVCEVSWDGAQDCPGRVFQGARRTLCVVPVALDLHAARSKCAELDGQLAAPRSAEEQAAFARGVETTTAWIGISDIQREGQWLHRDGSPVTDAPWSPGEPNDQGGNEDCGGLQTVDGKWNDDGCSAARPFLCSD